MPRVGSGEGDGNTCNGAGRGGDGRTPSVEGAPPPLEWREGAPLEPSPAGEGGTEETRGRTVKAAAAGWLEGAAAAASGEGGGAAGGGSAIGRRDTRERRGFFHVREGLGASFEPEG
jgi:hypothetical protein